MKIRDVEKEYKMEFDEDDKDKDLSVYLEEQGLESLAEVLKMAESLIN